MSLEEQIQPQHTHPGIIERLDHLFISLHEKIGSYWQSKTGSNKDSLSAGIEFTSSFPLFLGAQQSTNCFIGVATLMLSTYAALHSTCSLLTPSHESLQEFNHSIKNAFRQRSYGGKFIDVAFYIFAGFELLSVGLHALHPQTSSLDDTLYKELPLVAGLFLYFSSYYLRNVDVPQQPPRPSS